MNNISKVHDCYGCGVCATACGRKIIEIGLNENGFYDHTLRTRAYARSVDLYRGLLLPSQQPLAQSGDTSIRRME